MRPQDSKTEIETSIVKFITEQDAGETLTPLVTRLQQ